MSLVDSDFETDGFDEAQQAGFDEKPGAASNLPQPPKYRKQGFSIYSVMLILSFINLVAAIVLLFMEVERLNA
jgi:hypothetical protein